MDEPLTYYVYEEPPPPPAGVQVGYVVVWNGQPGPGSCMPVAVLHDGEGGWDVVPNGEFEFVTITAD